MLIWGMLLCFWKHFFKYSSPEAKNFFKKVCDENIDRFHAAVNTRGIIHLFEFNADGSTELGGLRERAFKKALKTDDVSYLE